jgi:hypothetical protein
MGSVLCRNRLRATLLLSMPISDTALSIARSIFDRSAGRGL